MWCKSHPSRVRGLKWFVMVANVVHGAVAPFTGAWIEIAGLNFRSRDLSNVAPFTGAWIEILNAIACVS